MSATKTDWIVPGAKVVVYRSTYEGDRLERRSAVARVAGKSFTVDGLDERIQLDTLQSKRIGSTWSEWRYVVISPEDPKVSELEQAARRSRAATNAIRAFNDWNTGAHRRDPAKVQASIDALTALRDAL